MGKGAESGVKGEGKLSFVGRVLRESDEIAHAIPVIRRGARNLYRPQIPRMAAALAYRTIFGIVPTVAISLIVFGSLVSDQQLEAGVSRMLHFTGLDQIEISESTLTGPPSLDEASPDSASPDEAVPAAGDDVEPSDAHGDLPGEGAGAGLDRPRAGEADEPGVDDGASLIDPDSIEAGGTGEEALPETPGPEGDEEETERLDGLIARLVGQINASWEKVPTASIAFISALVLIYAAVSMLVEVERAFNAVYRAPSGRPWGRRLLLYWTILTLGTLLLAATFAAGDLLKSTIEGWLGTGGGLIAFPVTVAISSVMLFVLYIAVPNTRVHVRPAVVGAVVAAVLWELGKWAFRGYIGFSTGYARLWGSMALLPLFLLWVYITWIVVLFGIQVSYTLQYAADLGDDDEHGGGDEGPKVVDPMCVLVVAAVVARRFADGLMTQPADVAPEARVSDRVADEMLELLRRARLLDRVSRGEGEGYVLSRPPERIEARAVLEAAGEWFFTPRGYGAIAEAARAASSALAGRTVADLAAEQSEPDPNGNPTPNESGAGGGPTLPVPP